MSDFKGKMHQNRFWLRPRPRWELTALPRSLAEFKGAFLRAGGGGGKWEGRRGRGEREGKGDPVSD